MIVTNITITPKADPLGNQSIIIGRHHHELKVCKFQDSGIDLKGLAVLLQELPSSKTREDSFLLCFLLLLVQVALSLLLVLVQVALPLLLLVQRAPLSLLLLVQVAPYLLLLLVQRAPLSLLILVQGPLSLCSSWCKWPPIFSSSWCKWRTQNSQLGRCTLKPPNTPTTIIIIVVNGKVELLRNVIISLFLRV